MFEKLVEELKLRGYSGKTVKAYLYHNTRFLEYTKKSARDVGAGDVRAYLGYLVGQGVKPRTLNLVHSALKFYYSEFMNKKLFGRIKKSKVEKDLPRILSKYDIVSMIDSTNNLKHKLLIQFLYSSGTRIAETVCLKVEDVDVENKLVFIKSGKGNKDRYIITSNKFLDVFC